MRQAREIADIAVPAAPETEIWANGTDATGALLELFESTPTVEETPTTEPVSAPPAPVISIEPWLAELAAEEQPQRPARTVRRVPSGLDYSMPMILPCLSATGTRAEARVP
jgi:hypothetical protein